MSVDVDVSRCKKIDFEDFVEVFLDLEEAVPGTCSPLGDRKKNLPMEVLLTCLGHEVP